MAHDRLSDARLIAPPMPCVPADLPALPGQTLARIVDEFGPPSCLAFIVEVNGEPVLRADWSREIAPGDTIVAIPLPRGGGDGKSILGIVAMIALAAFAPWAGGALAGAFGLSSTGLVAGAIGSAILAGGGILINTLLAPKPAATAAAQLEASPTYSTRAQGNQARLYSVIPVQYGEHVMVPDYVSDPYQEFQGNDQYLHLLFGRGLGRSEVAQVRIGETVVWQAGTGFTGALDDIEIAFYDPGEQVDLFPVQVETSSEVGGQLLADINWIGPFAAVPAGETSQRIAVDVVLSEGCYELTDSGSQVSATVALRFEYREIDDLGAAVGAGTWSVLADETITLTTATPQRFTWSLDVLAGRYEVRAQRTNAWSASDRRFDRSEWAGLRAYLDGPQAFDDLSTMAVRVRANEQLTSQSSRQFSIVQTRILPVWTGSAWEEQPTRSIAWAAVDIARNPVYGAGLADSRIDLATFAAYDAFWSGRGDTFNGVFDTRTTRFEAINTVLAAGRASVQFLGNRISLVRDEPRALAAQVFTDRNIARGSLEVDYALQKSDAADDVIVEYVDRTSWKQAEVRCTIAESISEAPARVRLIGPTDRGQAWREGIHLAADNFFRRTKATFRAELEGRLLKRGDVVLIQSEMPQTWGEAGVVRGIAGDDLTLSKEPSTDPLNTYLRVRRRDGGEWGPCKITWTPGSSVVTLDAADSAAADAEFGPLEPHLVDDGDEAPTYLLGEGTDYAFRGILVNMVPDGTGAQIELVIDDPAVHAADQGLSVPDAPQPGFLPPSAGAPVIDAMSVHREISVTESLVTVSARHPAGAVSFRAQVSYDGNAWTPVYEGAVPAFSASVRREAFYVRMQAVGDLPGPWRVELVAAAPEEVRFPTNAPIRATELYDAATETLKSAGDTISDLSTSILEQLNRIATEEDRRGRETDLRIRETDASRASIEETRVLIADEASARAASFLQLQADLSLAETGISGNATTISGLDTRVTSAEGAITAQATALTELSTTVDGNTASVTTLQTSVDGVKAQYGVVVSTNGVPAGTFLLTGVQTLDGQTSGQAVFDVDTFAVGKTGEAGTFQPLFAIDAETGLTVIKQAAIPDLVADKIKAGTITSEDGASWWKLSTPSEFVFEI